MPVKAALDLLGLCAPTPRLPRLKAGEATLTLLARAMGRMRELKAAPHWRRPAA